MRISRVSIGLATALSTVGVVGTSFVTGGVDASIGPDVIINELMIDPKDVYDSRGEWVELYNRGDAPADLAGWRLTDGRREVVVLPALTIAPGQHLVLTRHADAFVNGGADADWVYGNQVVLFNASDRLILWNERGEEEDRVDWYPGSGIAVPTGRSLARTTPGAASTDPASWCASTGIMVRGDLGSPGTPNDCAPADEHVVITEILQNPAATSDGAGEWFEVYNAGDTAVDLAGWTVKDDDRDRFVVPTSVVVPAGGYAVLATSGVANGGVDADYVYGASMALQNDWDELVLANAAGTLVDRVAWDDGRTFPDPNGASMSLLDPAADNAAAANWCTATSSWATGDRGTPHAPSWCVPPGSTGIVVTEIMFDPETPPSERASEWFEVANLGESAVDLTGWTITAGDYKVRTISGLVVEPGQHAVLAASGDPAANGGIEPDYVFGTAPDLPLYNTSGRVILKDAAGSIIDRVEWSAARGFPIPSGASITLGFPTTNNALGSNWCVSTARWGDGDFGTPGAAGTCAPPPPPPAMVVSEIHRNPAAVSDTYGEWFEVHNAGADDVDLIGWSLTDGASDRHVVRSSVIVPAGGYAVLGRSADLARNGGAAVAYAFGNGFVLGNNDDRIVLRDRYDQLVDQVAWSKGDGFPRPNGASVARVADGWCVSGPQFGIGDLGTPGVANDCTPLPHPDVVISEIHADPDAVSDTVGEWLEITNRTDQPVDLHGWVLRDDDLDQHVISGDGVVVAPGASIVLGRDLSDAVTAGAGVDYSYGSQLPLTNVEDEVTLLDPDLVWVDRVTWTGANPLPIEPGASASLRSLDLDNSDPANWCTSVTPFGTLGERGTPGTPNTCDATPPTTTTTTSTTTTSTTTTSTSTTSTTVPSGPALVRLTAICRAIDGERAGDYQFRVRHESGPGPLDYRLQIAGRVLAEGTIGAGEVQFVWLPFPSQGVKVVPVGGWTNSWGGTASTNSATCAPTATTSTTTTTTPTTTTTMAPTTTTLAPATGPALSSGYVLLALGDATCGNGLQLTGSKIDVRGSIRSNGNVLVQGSSVDVDGAISYAANRNVGGNIGATDVRQEPTPVGPGFAWTIADFAPGGRFSTEAGYRSRVGNWNVSGAARGIHFVDGDVTISGSKVDLEGVTLVVTGTVTVSGSKVELSPFRDDLPTVLAGGGTCTSAAINVSGSNVEWDGLLAAPNGLAQVNGSKPRGGQVMAAAIQVSGSDIRFE